VTVRVTMTVTGLGRSRFAFSAATEVVNLLRNATSSAPHLSRWWTRAAGSVDARSMALLTALAPVDHPYSLDFLTPPPQRLRESMDQAAEQIGETAPEIVDHHLDVAFRGRPLRPELVEAFGGKEALDAWRRPMPEVVADLVARGPRVVAVETARAMSTFFRHALGPDWARLSDLLQEDINHRAGIITSEGIVTGLCSLDPAITWNSEEQQLLLPRPYEVDVDWTDAGLLLIPSAALPGRALFSAERPATPSLVYPARSVAQLWQADAETSGTDLADLIGRTRARLLQRLDRPRSTAQLSVDCQLSAPTVSYHLGVLLRTGLVHRQRRGRLVLYERTSRAESLDPSRRRVE